MGLFERVLGTVSTFFQIGGPTGPRWKDNAGNIDARDAADAVFVNVRVANPVGNQDAVTLAYQGQSSANFQSHKVVWYNGVNTPATSGTNHGWTFISSAGSSSTPAVTTATKLSATRRTRWSVTAATSQLGVWDGFNPPQMVWRGNAPGVGGFRFVGRFSLTSLGNSSQIFINGVGVGDFPGSPGFVDYTTDTTVPRVMLVQSFTSTAAGGVPAGTNWLVSECTGGAGGLTLHNTGIPVALNDYIEVIVTAASQGTEFDVTVNNLTTGATFTIVLNTTIPSNTTFMSPAIHAAVNLAGTGGTNSIDTALIFCECFDG